MSLHPGLASEIQKLAPSAIIELYELDCTTLGGELLRFHAGTNGLIHNVVWQGNTYVRYPVTVTGFEMTGQGAFPRPKLQVSNVLSAISALLIQYDDLLGAKVTRKRTLAKFLDAVNFPAGNVNADPTAEFQADVYFIDRKSAESREIVELELASAIDLVGVALPRRQIIQNICVWKYRGPECGYNGPPLFDALDQQITNAPSVAGQNVLNLFALYQTKADAQTSAQAALSLASQSKDRACSYGVVETRNNYVITPDPNSGYSALTSITDGVVQSLGSTGGYWDGNIVTLGSTYVQGSMVAQIDTGFGTINIYSIQRWGVDTTACTNASTAYTAALSNYNSSVVAASAAFTAYDNASNALSRSDPTFVLERCGKRLSSCKARFGANNELPFGSFPSVGLIR